MYNISSSKLRAFNKKYGLTVVNSNQRLGMTAAENKAYDKFSQKAYEPPSLAIARTKRAVQENPGRPEYLLILIGAYLINDQKRRAWELQDQVIREYPDYVLGCVSAILNTHDEARILEVGKKLGPNLSIMDWPHNVEGGYGIYNYMQFECAVAKYLITKKEYEAAEARIERLLELGEPMEGLMQLIDSIVVAELQQGLGRITEANEKRVNVVEKITTGRPQRKKPSPLVLPELEDLRRTDTAELTKKQIDALMALPREQAIADLRTGLMDFVDLITLPKTFDSFPFNFTGLVTFWRLLVAYEEVDSLPLMLDVLRLDFESLEFYVDDFGEQSLVPGLAMLGRKCPDVLEEYLLEPYNSAYCRSYASGAMVQIGLHFPGEYEEMGQRLLRVLRHHLEHQENKGIFDTTLISFLALNLADLRYAAAMPVIEECFEQEIIETFICGSLDILRREIGFSRESSQHFHLPENSYEHFEDFDSYVPSPNPDRMIEEFVQKYSEDHSLNTRVTALKNKRRMEIISEVFEMQGAVEYEPDDFFDDAEVIQHPGTIVRIEKKVGRNDPCPCGSGKKYKKCCL